MGVLDSLGNPHTLSKRYLVSNNMASQKWVRDQTSVRFLSCPAHLGTAQVRVWRLC